jgi:hypothetical protein
MHTSPEGKARYIRKVYANPPGQGHIGTERPGRESGGAAVRPRAVAGAFSQAGWLSRWQKVL